MEQSWIEQISLRVPHLFADCSTDYKYQENTIWRPYIKEEIAVNQSPDQVRRAPCLWQPQLDVLSSPAVCVDRNLREADPVAEWNPFPIRNKEELEALEATLSRSEAKWEQLVSSESDPHPLMTCTNVRSISLIHRLHF